MLFESGFCNFNIGGPDLPDSETKIAGANNRHDRLGAGDPLERIGVLGEIKN